MLASAVTLVYNGFNATAIPAEHRHGKGALMGQVDFISGRRASAVMISLITIAMFITGCSSHRQHMAVPEHRVDTATVPDMPDCRVWGDAHPTASRAWLVHTRTARQHTYPQQGDAYLAISGGGADGAFAAGLLCGWTKTGKRPPFKLVTGISTGALAAPFALLGPDYDDTLREIYTTYDTDDLLSEMLVRLLFVGDAAADSAPLRQKIKQYISQDVVDALGKAHREGRTLLIGTTNLDAERPVIWNVTLIAATDHPDKVELIRSIMLASASVPGAFPPVFFQVEDQGEIYEEMHVDGGATAQVFLGPAWLVWQPTEQQPNPPTLYIIRNGKLSRDYKAVEVDVVSIAQRAMSSLIKSNGIADVYRMYVKAQENGLAYQLAYIPDDFDATWNEMFDPVYMRKLFDVGYQMAIDGTVWKNQPPGNGTE